MKSLIIKVFLSVFVLSIFAPVAKSNVSLPAIFSDNMVLQRNSEVKIWGWAKSNETVRVKADWMESEVKIRTGGQGTWEMTIETPDAGGPYTIKINGYNEIILKNILIGEVWLCSGQSNMEWSAQSGINNKDEEIKNANYPEIRFFSVYHSTSIYPQNHFTGEWTDCTPETMKNFSAIAYLFAKKLQEELGVPIGLINSSWGGTPAESWMPEPIFKNDEFLNKAASLQKPVPWGPVEPGRIYNAMIAPLVPFKIAGTLWYQGEANTVNAYAYQEILTGLINSWRDLWDYDFPFYFAQIAPYKYGDNFDGVMVRNEQRRVLEVENTGMIVLSDIGDTTNIHPQNKQDVALRFANLALNRHYKTAKIEDAGPLFKEMTIEKNKAIISFNHAEGLYVKGDELTYFEIAGEDEVYYPAQAKIKGQQVIVQSKKVKTPAKVRFAWRNTATPNLFNGANLPASCFISE